jgi:transcriptional regulator with XRE-family HTH domain
MTGRATTEDAAIGRAVSRLRKSRGLTQIGFALALRMEGLPQMHQTVLSRVERGERPLTLVEARVVAAVLGVTTGDLG